jgi:DNA polymerase-4
MGALCRTCGGGLSAQRVCLRCGGTQVLAHPELFDLSIAHVDCDAFFAAIEKRDAPHLKDQPVIIGGGQRGVVSTACYVARRFGVRSAMPMFKARKLCPDAIIIKPNMAKYAATAKAVRQFMLQLTPLVEPVSIDEAFLDLGGTERVHGRCPAASLVHLAAAVEREIGITLSIGLSHNKFLAKIASDMNKPRGFSVIGVAETMNFLAPRPVGLIWGVGARMQEHLQRDGLSTIGDLRRLDETQLVTRYGATGARLYRLCRGIDDRPVSIERQTKSISAETTFNEDMSQLDLLAPILWRLSEKVARRLKEEELAATSITLKLKTSRFRTLSRSRSNLPPTQLATRIFEHGQELLKREATGTAFRLIGIGVQEFAPAEGADAGDLVDQRSRTDAKAEKAIDALRARFGDAIITRGTGVGPR